jgi:hypothetical protein
MHFMQHLYSLVTGNAPQNTLRLVPFEGIKKTAVF